MSARTADPFAVTADPDAYVPRPAAEEALAALEQGFARERRCAVLTGPPGIGKTMLLRVLERRLAPCARCVYLPYAALGIEDLCQWVLGILGEPAAGRGEDAPEDLLAWAARSAHEGRPLLVVLDDASALPPETARAWARLAERAGGALRLLLSLVDDERAGRALAALGEDVLEVRYSQPLSAAESDAFLRGRLARASAPAELAARFDAPLRARLHDRARGNPRRLQMVATEVVLHGTPGSPGARAGVPDGPAGPPRAVEELALEPGVTRLPPTATPLPPRDAPTTTEPRLLAPSASASSAARPPAEAMAPPSPDPIAEASPRSEPPPAGPEPHPAASPVRRDPRAPAPRPSPEPPSGAPPAGPERRPVPSPARPGLRPAAAGGEAAGAESTKESGLAPARTPTPGTARRPEPAPAPRRRLLPLAAAALVLALGWWALRSDGPSPPPEPTAGADSKAAPPAGSAAEPRDGRSPGTSVEEAGTPPPRAAAAERGGDVAPATPETEPTPSAGATGEPAEATPPDEDLVQVNVNAFPWARIEIDGAPRGETPLAGIPLATGPHHFRVVFPDGRVLERVEELGPDNRFLSFRPPEPPE